MFCSLWTGLHIPRSHRVNVFYSICFAETDVAIVKVSHFTAYLLNQCCTFAPSPTGPIRKHLAFGLFPPPPLPLEVTVSANLLVGRHQSFVLQNTNLLPLCSCKERSALLMQRRCQINAWRGGLYNGSCCKAGWWSAPCIHRVNEVKYWKSLAVFFRIRESRMWRISHAVFLKPNLTFYVHKAFSPPINGKALTLTAFHEDVTCNVSSHAPDNKTIVIKYYYLLYSKWYYKLICRPFVRKMKQGWWYRFGHSLSSFTVYWKELL